MTRDGVPSSDNCYQCQSVAFEVCVDGRRRCTKCKERWANASSPVDLKPRGVKAPLHLIPARPIRAIAAAFGNGAQKYAPWNWVGQTKDWREAYGAALRRHVEAFTDPNESDYADDSGIHHLAHAGACLLILLFKLGLDYPALSPCEERD